MQALQNIKVIDLTFTSPGAYCTMILGDLGAEVIKVEAPPAIGLDTMGSAKSPTGDNRRREAAFYALNRGKKSIGLNLKSADGIHIFNRMARGADIILEGFRPGVMKRLGIDYDSLYKVNPQIVYCSLSGYGQSGPYSCLPGHDVNYISMGGALGLIGQEGHAPVIPQNLVGDFAGGSLFAVIGITTALLARQRTGRGQFVDASITDGVVSLLSLQASQYFATGKVPRRGSTTLGGGYPYYGVYETGDGKYISIGCLEPRFWKNLCHAVGKNEYAQYGFMPGHHTERPKGKKWAEIRRTLRDTFRTKTRDEWFDILTKAEVTVGKVYSVEELVSDPQLLHRNMVVQLDHPQIGKVTQVGIPIKLSDTPGAIQGFSPILGEHSDQLLSELGYDNEEIKRFRDAGVVA